MQRGNYEPARGTIKFNSSRKQVGRCFTSKMGGVFAWDKSQDTLRGRNAGWAPPCNAYEKEHGSHIQVPLPGVDRQDMQILFEDGVLTVKRTQGAQCGSGPSVFRSRNWGAALPGPLPSYIDPDKVSASYKDGVLVLGLPKREDAKPRRIEIT